MVLFVKKWTADDKHSCSKRENLFVNTLTADNKYSCQVREYFPLTIQLQVSKKSKDFINFFCSSGNQICSSNFQHFEDKDEGHSLRISQTIDSETPC